MNRKEEKELYLRRVLAAKIFGPNFFNEFENPKLLVDKDVTDKIRAEFSSTKKPKEINIPEKVPFIKKILQEEKESRYFQRLTKSKTTDMSDIELMKTEDIADVIRKDDNIPITKLFDLTQELNKRTTQRKSKI